MYVVYSSNSEVIITTLENEHETIQVYFTQGGRVLEDYDREALVASECAVCIRPRLFMD